MINPVELDHVRKRCDEPNMVTYCGLLMRPGLHAWTVEVEYTMFTPDTDANDDFHLAYMKWPDDTELPYSVATFDKRGQEFAESILWKHGLKKLAKGFTAMVIGGGRTEKFPLTGDNVFFLENHSRGASNVLYTNNPMKMKRAWEHELKQCQVFFDEHKRWIETPEGKAIAGAYWKKHPEGHVE